LENLNDSDDIKWGLGKHHRGDENLSYIESKSVRIETASTWFGEECLHFLDQRQQAKIQWLQNAKQSNVDNLNNVGHAASRHLRNKKEGMSLKAKFEELETKSMFKYIRDL
jgi:hypothetical protein